MSKGEAEHAMERPFYSRNAKKALRDPALQRFISEIQVKFPECSLAIKPYSNNSDPEVVLFIYIKDVPESRLSSVSKQAWLIALQEYGDETIPFHLGVLTSKAANKYGVVPSAAAAAAFAIVSLGRYGVLGPVIGTALAKTLGTLIGRLKHSSAPPRTSKRGDRKS